MIQRDIEALELHMDGVGDSKINQSPNDDWDWCMYEWGMCIHIARHVHNHSYVVWALNE